MDEAMQNEIKYCADLSAELDAKMNRLRNALSVNVGAANDLRLLISELHQSKNTGNNYDSD